MTDANVTTILPCIILYSKPGCHLCDIARSVLDELAAQPEYQGTFTIAEVNIRLDPDTFARYRYRIPVVMLEQAIIAEGNIAMDSLPAIVAALQQTRLQ